MPLQTFAGDPAFVPVDSAGNFVPGIQHTVWTHRTGGTQVTALFGLDATPLPGFVTPDQTGMRFMADTDRGSLWVRTPEGVRYQILSTEAIDAVPQAIEDAATAIAEASNARADATEALTLSETATLAAMEANENAAQAVSASPVAIAVNARAPQFGAAGDGVTDDTASVQSALNFLSGSSGTVMLTEGTYQIGAAGVTIPDGVTLRGNGNVTLRLTGPQTAVYMSSRTTLEGVRVVGSLSTGAQATSQAERGVRAAGSWPSSPVTDVTISNVIFENLHYIAIHTDAVDRLKVTGCRFLNIGYAGAFLNCTHNINFSDNYVYGTGVLPTYAPNSYGVTTTIAKLPVTSTNPRPRNATIHRNIIENQAWEAIDTHAGDGVSVIGNITRDCEMGVAITIKEDAPDAGPFNCVVADNIIVRGAYPQAAVRAGISINVESTTIPGTAHITGNLINGHGVSYQHPAQASPYRGAISVNKINSCIIAKNTVQDAIGAAISLRSTDAGIIDGNMIVGVWREVGDATRVSSAVNLQASGNVAPIVISGNVLTAGTSTRTNLNERAVYDLDNGGSKIATWGNQWGGKPFSGVTASSAGGRAIDLAGDGRVAGGQPNVPPGTTPLNATAITAYPPGESHWNATDMTKNLWPANGLLVTYNYTNRGVQIIWASVVWTRAWNSGTSTWGTWRQVTLT